MSGLAKHQQFDKVRVLVHKRNYQSDHYKKPESCLSLGLPVSGHLKEVFLGNLVVLVFLASLELTEKQVSARLVQLVLLAKVEHEEAALLEGEL